MKIKLEDWAARLYAPPPSAFVLRKWCRNGEITPIPEKVGRDWYVDASAKRRNPDAPLGSLVDRMRAA